jgi:hypothetical protein
VPVDAEPSSASTLPAGAPGTLLTKPRAGGDADQVPAGSNGHKVPGEDTIMLAAIDAGSLAELDEAHGR